MEPVTASVSSFHLYVSWEDTLWHEIYKGAGDDGLLFKSKLNIDLDLLIV